MDPQNEQRRICRDHQDQSPNFLVQNSTDKHLDYTKNAIQLKNNWRFFSSPSWISATKSAIRGAVCFLVHSKSHSFDLTWCFGYVNCAIWFPFTDWSSQTMNIGSKNRWTNWRENGWFKRELKLNWRKEPPKEKEALFFPLSCVEMKWKESESDTLVWLYNIYNLMEKMMGVRQLGLKYKRDDWILIWL